MTSTAVPRFRIVKVVGHVDRKSVNIFIDCGSSHNFIHPEIIKKLGLKTQKTTTMIVEVANGNKITTNELCSNFKWKSHGHEFVADLLVLLVGGCQVVLGDQWLSTLGDIK
ncbi:hypothetical protein ACH5RR_013323 [Cinchona calisaya]|uniref:Uncharacterized protein n=1 Tax=Cinchona calisaya TaxID=153742 RepID=A0ABD3A1X6_9GENT